MSDKLKIYCKNIDQYVDIQGGETLLDIAKRINLGFEPICARVNNKNENLGFPVFTPKQVEYLSIFTSSGERAYIRSLCMILYKAVENVCPQYHLRIAHYISRGYYCHLVADGESYEPLDIPDQTIEDIKAEMRRIVDADLPLQRKERLTADAIEIFKKQGLSNKVKLLETTRQLYTIYYKLDGLCDSFYSTLAPSTGYMRTFDLIPYKRGMLLMSFDYSHPEVPVKPVPQEKMYEAFKRYLEFNNILGVRNVGELNQVVIDKKSTILINVAEALHEKYLSRISDEIARRYDEGGARIVLLAGPSSSGKTTTCKRIAVQLMTNLLWPQMISLDDYFVDREHTPRDENGEYDYESLYALDLKQFNSDLCDILAGKEVELPYYNFQTGKREYRGHKIKLEDRSVLLIEGIHGLNPELTASIEEKMKYRIFVSALTTLSIDDHNWISASDNRLLRRIIRDNQYRNSNAEDTLHRWPSVRQGEEKWIVPYQENADAMFNSSLLFELGVIKTTAEALLERVPRDVPEYSEACRLRTLLSYFLPIEQVNIPSTSLLREFVGGSSFEY